ncbi:MAG: hypothetical protein JSW07_21175 [bacterium]|nr:MAG: hypothetical protein JSW07_21175 [bacterium]
MRIMLKIFFCLLLTTPCFSQTLSEQLSQDINDSQLGQFSRIEAAFIISGADSNFQLQKGLQWFNDLLQDIRAKNLIGFDKIPSAEKLFLYLHTSWLQDYQKKATTLFDIMQRKAYNCVSATVLYNLLCDAVGLSTEAFETPTHVYTIFTNITQQVMVENTTSMGFNIMKNLQRYSQYLLQYYPQNEALKIGLDRLYGYEHSNGRTINNTELLGLICYNLAIFNTENKNYEKAYYYVKLAQLFNADSRSNIKFEISLYYRWGGELFKAKKFYDAFEVTADAYYRYPDNDDFKKNCQNAFINSLQQLWMNKDWEKTESVILEMSDLEILTKRESTIQKRILKSWINYLSIHQQVNKAERAKEIFKNYY